ncbi:sensor histidine kinase [Marinomonas primoryensis]|jgi:signal transduction histidine kinase|uniref:sensor histidine kinase n=1 Tax=Marinomonas primoryensis TaxID=178399 RepID=UPI0037038B74
MNSMIFFKNKIVLICFLFLTCVIFLIYFSENLYRKNHLLIDNQEKSSHLFYSIGLMQVSQNLIGLDKQRSQNVFLQEYSKILKEYKKIQSDLKSSNALTYSSNISPIISLLEDFNEKIKIRNDYIYRKNNLKVIISNSIDLNENNEQIYLWKLLDASIDSRNLIELGEHYREFVSISKNISFNIKDAESKKIKSVSSGFMNIFSTIEKIISINVVLNQNIDEIIRKTDVLSNNITDSFFEIEKIENTFYTRVLQVLVSFFSVVFLIFLVLSNLYINKQNRNIFSSLSRSADIKSINLNRSLFDALNEKDLLIYSRVIPYIVKENNPSFILADNNDMPLYCSNCFYEQNEEYFSKNNNISSIENLKYSIQDDHYFLSIGPSKNNQRSTEGITKNNIMSEIASIKKLDEGGLKIIFIKSAIAEQDKQNERLDSLATITGAVAHDINNMISVIVSSLSILRGSKSLNDADGSKVIDRALFSADKSISLIDRLLTFSRCKKLNPELVNVNELLEGLYEVICFATSDKINVELILSDKPLYIYIDAGQLETSIINLCINSSNAIQGEGKISIISQLNTSDRVSIVVEDNGHGIPKNIQSRVFEPFFTGRKKGEGHGLGLSMVYGFVKQSGGSIFLESKVGFGTKISISFSLKKT